jgi:hypothetical protein
MGVTIPSNAESGGMGNRFARECVLRAGRVDGLSRGPDAVSPDRGRGRFDRRGRPQPPTRVDVSLTAVDTCGDERRTPAPGGESWARSVEVHRQGIARPGPGPRVVSPLAQAAQRLVDDVGVEGEGEDGHRPPASWTGLDVDVPDPAQQLGPSSSPRAEAVGEGLVRLGVVGALGSRSDPGLPPGGPPADGVSAVVPGMLSSTRESPRLAPGSVAWSVVRLGPGERRWCEKEVLGAPIVCGDGRCSLWASSPT